MPIQSKKNTRHISKKNTRRTPSTLSKSIVHNKVTWTINHDGVGNTLDIEIPQKRAITIDGTILKMTKNVDLRMVTNVSGFLTNQSIFLVNAIATDKKAKVTVSPCTTAYGDIIIIDMSKYANNTIHVMKSNYIASTCDVQLSVSYGKSIPKILFSSGLFYLKAASKSGTGVLALHGYGRIEKHRVTPESPLKVHRQHLVAWDDGVKHNMTKPSSGWLPLFLSKQNGPMTEFSGDGYVYLQTRKKTYTLPISMDTKNYSPPADG